MGQVTERTIAKFISALYAKQAEKYGGDTTINQLRTMAQCYLIHTETGEGTSITELSDILEMPTSTVHRSVTELIQKGWLRDSPHPTDGRRRIVELSEQGVSGGLWAQGIEWIREYSED